MRKSGPSAHSNQTEPINDVYYNYFQTLRTNAILEGFNSKISIIKSRARGFRNMRNFMNMIYFVCGELSLPLQPIM
jgi:hypothetical protein